MPSARKLGRRADQRRAMLRGMVTLLLDKGRIETTLIRAKELKRVADKMITIGKKNTLAAKRAALGYITKEEVVKKLFDIIAPSFEDRSGGYTRILKLGPRRGDGAEMAIIELVNYTLKEKDKSKKTRTAKAQENKAEEVKETPKKTQKTEKAEKTEKTEKTEKVKPEEMEDKLAEIAEEIKAAEEPEETEEVEEVEEAAAEETEAAEESKEEKE